MRGPFVLSSNTKLRVSTIGSRCFYIVAQSPHISSPSQLNKYCHMIVARRSISLVSFARAINTSFYFSPLIPHSKRMIQKKDHKFFKKIWVQLEIIVRDWNISNHYYCCHLHENHQLMNLCKRFLSSCSWLHLNRSI